MKTVGTSKFNFKLNHDSVNFGRRNEGWSMSGEYSTKVNEKGVYWLEMDGVL